MRQTRYNLKLTRLELEDPTRSFGSDLGYIFIHLNYLGRVRVGHKFDPTQPDLWAVLLSGSFSLVSFASLPLSSLFPPFLLSTLFLVPLSVWLYMSCKSSLLQIIVLNYKIGCFGLLFFFFFHVPNIKKMFSTLFSRLQPKLPNIRKWACFLNYVF